MTDQPTIDISIASVGERAILTLNANVPSEERNLLKALVAWLDHNPEAELLALSYTPSANRCGLDAIVTGIEVPSGE